MRTLYLVRHAKSDQAFEELADIDRPLNPRGYRDAPAMARLVHKRGVAPELMISSPAVRALSTALIFARELDYPVGKLVLDSRIYESSVATMLQVIGEQSAPLLVLFGHNPTFSELATELSGVTCDMPTAGIVSIKFSAGSWAKAVIEHGELELFDYPKNHN